MECRSFEAGQDIIQAARQVYESSGHLWNIEEPSLIEIELVHEVIWQLSMGGSYRFQPGGRTNLCGCDQGVRPSAACMI